MDEANMNVGYKAVNMLAPAYENKESILKCFPTGHLSPQPFIEGSRAKLEKVAAAVKLKHGHDFPGAVVQWDEFLANAPQSDDADEYVKEHPLYVPFTKELFGIDSEDDRYADGRDDCVAKNDQFHQDAAVTTNELDAEIWRTLPCMAKNAKAALERVRKVKQDDGKYLPFCCCSCSCCCVSSWCGWVCMCVVVYVFVQLSRVVLNTAQPLFLNNNDIFFFSVYKDRLSMSPTTRRMTEDATPAAATKKKQCRAQTKR
jgi:hypothetical protein